MRCPTTCFFYYFDRHFSSTCDPNNSYIVFSVKNNFVIYSISTHVAIFFNLSMYYIISIALHTWLPMKCTGGWQLQAPYSWWFGSLPSLLLPLSILQNQGMTEVFLFLPTMATLISVSIHKPVVPPKVILKL